MKQFEILIKRNPPKTKLMTLQEIEDMINRKTNMIEMFNGSFLECPNCHKLMAHGYHAKGNKWACLFGCGLILYQKGSKGRLYFSIKEAQS